MNKGVVLKRFCIIAGVVFLFVASAAIPSTSKMNEISPLIDENDGTLSGYVTDTSMNPIEGALVQVYFHETYEENYTDEIGYYYVDNIPICYCMKNCTCSKEGYETEWVLLAIVENTTYDFVLTSLDPIPDLICYGDLCWTEIMPGETITGDFTVENIGEPGSLLNWEIESYPDWGTDWTFDPDSFEGLTPEDGAIIVDVMLIAPNDPNVEICGKIRVVNVDDPSDYDFVDISLAISFSQQSATSLINQNTMNIVSSARNTIEMTSFEPVPDLDCGGDLFFIDCEPGATVTGMFTVKNIGEPDSELDWEIVDWPEWGTWTFVPESGEDITPEDGPITIDVECVLPDEIEDDLWDEVKIFNLENSSDYCIIDVFVKGDAVPIFKNINQQFTTISTSQTLYQFIDTLYLQIVKNI